MLNKYLKKYTFILLIIPLFLFSFCKKKHKDTNTTTEDRSTFDKKAMLLNIADKLIIPDYKSLKTVLDSLHDSFEMFKSNSNIVQFQDLKLKLHRAYLTYQRVNIYGLGPGEDLSIRSNFNVFPSKTSLIESNIRSGTYNLESLNNLATKGFPALDYLIYGLNKTEAEQIQLLTDDANRINYFADVLTNMRNKTNAVITSWETSYRETFINSLGTDIGSSIGFLVNQINFELDFLKNAKIGIPLGLKSGGTILPQDCEAYYGGQSVEYALETLRAIENVYLGRSNNSDEGIGFDDYLVHLDLKHGGSTLHESIKKQFGNARTSLKAVSNPLSEQIKTNPSLVNNAYKELVKLLVLLKTDMPSGLGVIITYQDGDGD